MTKYKLAVALLCGAGFTSLLAILLKGLSHSAVSLFLSLLLLPGGAMAHLLAKSEESDPPLLVLALCVAFYSIVTYAALSVFARDVRADKMRLVAIRLLLPVVIVVGLVCIPAINPLWPRGMVELTRQEITLQNALPVGIGLDGARAVLRSRNIKFQERTMASHEVALDHRNKSMTAMAGDKLIFARFETDASQFPCDYDMEVVLLFGQDQRLKDEYVHRLRTCP